MNSIDDYSFSFGAAMSVNNSGHVRCSIMYHADAEFNATSLPAPRIRSMQSKILQHSREEIERMNFPETRNTLIQRIVTTNEEDAWRQFMEDYWRPVCRFASRWGRLSVEDSEDVASVVFEALIVSRLLERRNVNPSAKLRTLLCSVTRNVLSNRARVASGRERLVRETGRCSSNSSPCRLSVSLMLSWKLWTPSVRPGSKSCCTRRCKFWSRHTGARTAWLISNC